MQVGQQNRVATSVANDPRFGATTPDDPAAPLSALGSLDQRKPYLAITAQGSEGFDSLMDVDAAGAKTTVFNIKASTLTDSLAPGDALLLGQGSTLTVPNGLYLELSDSGITSRPGTTVKDLNLVATGSGRLRVTCSGATLTAATAPRLEGGLDQIPIRYESTVPGALTVINKAVGNITNQRLNPDSLFTVYLIGACTTGTIGANVKVVEMGGGTPGGTPRDLLEMTPAFLDSVMGLAYDDNGDAPLASTPTGSYPGQWFNAIDANGNSFRYECGRFRYVAGDTTAAGTGPVWSRQLRLQP